MGDAVYDEVEIEDMEFVKEKNTFFYPCPCGDKFEITFGVCIPVLQQAREHAPARCHVCVCVCVRARACVCERALVHAACMTRTLICDVLQTCRRIAGRRRHCAVPELFTAAEGHL